MNTIKDFKRFIKEYDYNDGSNFETLVYQFAEDHCDLADMAYLMKHLNIIYTGMIYNICDRTTRLESDFHKRANDENTPEIVGKLCSVLEDEMIILRAPYKGVG